MADLADLGVAELLAAYASGEALPSEALAACLGRIDRLDGDVNAFLTVCAEAANGEAKAADKRWARGEARALEGIPFGIKDVIETAAVRTTAGSALYEDHLPRQDATVVRQLREAGAISVGKTQTFAFALGGADNIDYGPTRNPWNLSKTAGGTSSGSGAAVGARQVPLALGTDTGGSTRIPAAYCGVTGLKPTYGRLSTKGMIPLSWSLDHVGLLARSSADIGLALAGIGDHGKGRELSGLRIGIANDWFNEFCDGELLTVADIALDVLREAGAIPVRIELPNAHLAEDLYWLIVLSEAASIHQPNREHFDRYDPAMAERLRDAEGIKATDYLAALRLRALLADDYRRAFDQVDVLLTPASSVLAPDWEDPICRIDGRDVEWIDAVSHMTCPFNVIGLPAISVPAGLSGSGLPIGVQLVAPRHGDHLCLAVGEAFQQLTEHHRQLPPLLGD